MNRIIKSSSLVLLILFLSVFLLPAASRATFIESYDPMVPLGDGAYNITQDTDTGLEWLDIWSTGLMSYDQLKGGLSPGGILDGFRLAGQAELMTFFTNARLFDNDYNSYVEFLRLVGFNYGTAYESLPLARGDYPDPAFSAIAGIYDTDTSPLNVAQILIHHPAPCAGSTGYGMVQFFTWPENYTYIGYEVTAWLVRDTPQPTPDPATIILLGMGLSGMAAYSRKKHRNRRTLP